MKHLPVSILGIIALAGIIGMLSLSGELAPFAVKNAPLQPGNTYIASLQQGESIGDKISALSEYQLSRLAGGTIHSSGKATQYSQIIVLSEPGLFDGGQLSFGKTENGETGTFLAFDDAVFKLQILFASGLRSEIKENRLPDLNDESLSMLGDEYSILDTRFNVQTRSITLVMYGGFGRVEFTDGNSADGNFYQGVKINGNFIDAGVRIRTAEENGALSIYSIEYLLSAHPARGALEVPPLHCIRNQLIAPEGMLSPDFDICYRSSASPKIDEAIVKPLGSSQYAVTAPNARGVVYKIPLAQMAGEYGNRGRNFVFVEAADQGSPNINPGDSFLVNSRNDISGDSHILRYDRTAQNTIYFEDAGNMRAALFNIATGEGELLAGEGTYRFVVAANGALAIDQNNDGQINGGEARFVLLGGSRLDFGPGFTVTYTTPSRLFTEPAGDENTQFDLTFNSQIDLDLPSPQGDFSLKSAGGGVKQGMTRYGTLFTWKQQPSSDSLHISLGARSSGGVYITLERPLLVKEKTSCGDSKLTPPEICDPPKSSCKGEKFFERGTCAKDCASCITDS